jgi:anti-anti-sigma regulatory factor
MASETVDDPRDAQLRWRKTRSTGENCEASVAGCADIFSAPALAELAAELYRYSSVVLDVSELDLGDATFLRFLLRLREREHRTIRVTGARAHLKRLLEVTGLGSLFS